MKFLASKLKAYLRAGATAAFLWLGLTGSVQSAVQEVTVGIGTQNTTTNTVTGGIVLEKLGLLDKHMPKTGKYANIKFIIDWQNFTSGPPVTNGMVANKLQIGMMGDYPLLVNGATFQATTSSAQATAWWCTRIRPSTNSPISRARRCPCLSVQPRTE